MKKKNKISLHGQTININNRIYSLMDLENTKPLIPPMLKISMDFTAIKLGTEIKIK